MQRNLRLITICSSGVKVYCVNLPAPQWAKIMNQVLATAKTSKLRLKASVSWLDMSVLILGDKKKQHQRRRIPLLPPHCGVKTPLHLLCHFSPPPSYTVFCTHPAPFPWTYALCNIKEIEAEENDQHRHTHIHTHRHHHMIWQLQLTNMYFFFTGKQDCI